MHRTTSIGKTTTDTSVGEFTNSCGGRIHMGTLMVRILVVDDHPLVRQGIMRVLREEFLSSEIGEASNGPDALNSISSRTWNLVLLDISLPGRNGIDLLKEIKAARANLPVLILSTYPEAQFAIRSLRAGAAGYLNKESPPET